MITAKKIWNQHLLISRIKQGFTLAEVLITLTIIGIIAALTIPNLVYSIQQSRYSVQAKKTYSVVQQAYNLSINEEGTSGYGVYLCAGAINNKKWTAIMSKMNVIKTCNGNTFGNCWAAGGVPGISSGGCAQFSQANQNNNSAFITSDGTAFLLYGNNGVGTCDLFLVDLDGPNKGPNQLGIDVLGGWMMHDTTVKIEPIGCNAGITNQGGKDYITN